MAVSKTYICQNSKDNSKLSILSDGSSIPASLQTRADKSFIDVADFICLHEPISILPIPGIYYSSFCHNTPGVTYVFKVFKE